MKRVEQVEPVETSVGDPVDALVALADHCGANAIAGDARRAYQQLESARLVVVAVGSGDLLAPMLQRVGAEHALADRGVSYELGTLDTPFPSSRRVDLVIVDESEAADPKIEKWSGVRMLVLDTSREDERAKAFAAIEQLAIETGAARVETQVVQHTRQLCRRLQHHLNDRLNAVAGIGHDMSSRINSLTIARVLADIMFDTCRRQRDPARDQLAAWLAVERTRFLMGETVDAVVAFDERFAGLAGPRHLLRRAASDVASEIGDDLLAMLAERMRIAAEAPIAAYSKQLLAQLDSWLGDLGAAAALDAMAGMELVPIRGFRRTAENLATSGMLTHLSDRMRLTTRARIQELARREVVTRLESGSCGLVARVLDDYDDNRWTLERRFCDLLDGAIDSARLADDLAKQARACGPDTVESAIQRVACWSASLSDIIARVD
ncbi:MAG: hypothetical protein H0T89_17045 [Deltaproteobacteria bacterium]|nr:hypothetical protein [Deltaproteobacteria bacterium]MDQ3294988.1 hypothetical protein [Myxococcota bacterium]